jgi:hypothetical protein
MTRELKTSQLMVMGRVLTLSHNYRYAEVLHLTEKRLENLIFILK